jgi:hypothetical protein
MVLVRVSNFKKFEGLPWSKIFIEPTFFDGTRDLVAYAYFKIGSTRSGPGADVGE